MIGGQGEDSCGKSASEEGAQRPPAESEALQGHHGVTSDLYELLYPVCSSLGWIHLVMSQPLFCF
ncbi:hypothetical protein P4643_21160 [Priestia megaterium]|uniref:hypothetical protein n=1 Tax=Priestia megaterium TaxID=1404 RepID=UPI002E1C885A|nr:hypothetical protein [Priestia megaterium]